MQNLYNELISGSTEYNDKGEMLSKPPTSLMLRAARTLKTLADTNDTNMANIQSMQASMHRDHEVYRQLHSKINELTKELEQLLFQQKDLYSQLVMKEENESLRNDARQSDGKEQISDVGNSGTDDSAVHRRSEGGVQFDDCGLGSN